MSTQIRSCKQYLPLTVVPFICSLCRNRIGVTPRSAGRTTQTRYTCHDLSTSVWLFFFRWPLHLLTKSNFLTWELFSFPLKLPLSWMNLVHKSVFVNCFGVSAGFLVDHYLEVGEALSEVWYCIAQNFRQEFNFVAFIKAIFWLT